MGNFRDVLVVLVQSIAVVWRLLMLHNYLMHIW